MQEPMETDVQVAPAAIDESLNFFSLPAQDVGVSQRKWVTVRPVNTITEESAVEFNVEGNEACYIDLKNSTLRVKLQVLKEDGSEIPITQEVAPVNLFLQSLWQQVDIQFNYENLKGVNIYYPYKAMLDTLLFTTEGYKSSQLAAQLFYKDNAGVMDADKIEDGNSGYMARRDQVAKSRMVELEGGLFLDLCQQERLILNGVHLNIKLWPSRNAFKFMSSASPVEHKVKISEAYLKLCMVTVNPAVMVAQRDVIEEAPAVYPFNRSEIRVYSLSKSEMNLNVENLFNGEVPHFLCVALVSTDGFNGDYHKNPFNFANFNLCSIGFYVDGSSLPCEAPFKPDYTKGLFTQPYLALSANKKGDHSFNNGIYLDEFDRGYAIYVFNIRSEKELKRKALTKLSIDFKEPLQESVTVITYAQFPDILQIDRNNRVIQS